MLWRAKLSLLEEAFTGCFTDQHAFLLAKMLARIDALSADIAALDARIEALIGPLAQTVDRLDEIPGVGQLAAHLLIAELGTDMTRFPTAGHLVSWAKFAPVSRSPPASARAADGPGTATRIWLECSARPPSPLGRPIPSSMNATGGSPVDAARNEPSSRSAGPSWSSSGTCCPTRPYGSTTWAPASTTPPSVLNAPGATTSASWRPSATRSPSTPPPDQPSPNYQRHADRIPGSPGHCRMPTHRGFSFQDEAAGSSPARPTTSLLSCEDGLSSCWPGPMSPIWGG